MEHMPEFVAYAFDGKGGARKMTPDQLARLSDDDNSVAFTWMHLNRESETGRAWLQQRRIDQFVVDALTAEETRPRCTIHEGGALLNLRGCEMFERPLRRL